MLCKDKSRGPVYNHHFFECAEFRRNCRFFRESVESMCKDYVSAGNRDIPNSIINKIISEPSRMWVGLFDTGLFDLGLRLRSAHELHRIVTMSSVLSWGRFYPVP